MAGKVTDCLSYI